ncbi:hypothetical protein [Streptomyces griseoluteus]|uniref:hypothetical protein n=1 Tax=Streptomyces griseoluteus TaxID=29306 RepID=UPI00364FEAA7
MDPINVATPDQQPVYFAADLGQQAPALAALARLAADHPHLPPGYIVVSETTPRQVDVMLDTPGMIEPWREALGAAPETVDQKPFRSTDFMLICQDVVGGITWQVWASFSPSESPEPQPAESGAGSR